MDKDTFVEIVERFRLGIEARGVKAQKVILYGSHAHGTSAIASDIDVVVISEDFAGKGFWERVDILSDVIYESAAPLEVVAMTRMNGRMENHLLSIMHKEERFSLQHE